MWLLNVRELFAHLPRTVLSAVVMGISAGLLVAVLGLVGSVTSSVERLSSGLAGNASLEVSGITSGGFGEALLSAVRKVPGVKAAVPMIRSQVVAPGEGWILVVGADASAVNLKGALADPLVQRQGDFIDGVLVGDALGLAKGDALVVGPHSVKVSGVLDGETSDRLNGGHVVVAALATAQRLTGRANRLDSIQVVTDPEADIDAVRTDLAAAVDGRAVVADPELRSIQASGAMRLIRYTTLMAAAAALAVSAFLIYNAVSMSIAQRRPMLSMLRALGASRRQLLRGLLVEATEVAVVGSVGGAVIGLFMGKLAIITIPPAILQSVEARIEYFLPWYAIPIAVGICVAASVAASAAAAAALSRVLPVDAMTQMPAASARPARQRLRTAALVGGLIVAALAVVVTHTELGRWSVAGISLAFVAAVWLLYAASPVVVRLCASVARRLGAAGVIGASALLRAPRRVWATTITVMIGVAATVAVGGASSNLMASASSAFDSLGDIDAVVSAEPMKAFPTGPMLPPDLRAKVEAVPGVARVTNGQMAHATLGNSRVIVQAIQPNTPNDAVKALRPGTAARMAAGEGIAVSRDVARALGVIEGDQVRLPTPTGVREVTVLQIIPFFSIVGGVVLMDFDVFETWYQSHGATVLNVFYADGADSAAVTARIREVVPAELNVETGKHAVESISAGVGQGAAMSNAILWIICFVATVALLNTLMLSVMERRRELAVLRAIGAPRALVLRSVLAEAIGIGVVGAGLGIVVGAATQYLATSAMSQVMTIAVGYHPSPLIVIYGAVALVLTLIGSLPPALSAARLPVIRALAID